MTHDETTRTDTIPSDAVPSDVIESDGVLDAQLVERALDGDRSAMAAIYDAHADRIHTMCVHMLGDRDEAADVCGEVFLVALQRLHQLREPAKLRSWLFAIARNEVYRRTKARSRVRPVEELDDMAALAGDAGVLEEPAVDATAESPAADPELLAELVQNAAGGLDERDRMVLELNVAQGLEGGELADALGVSVEHSYQLTHRMRERFERSAGALLVVSAGREHCGDLDEVASKWNGTYDVLWRKRFARHVDRCQRCSAMRSKLPKAVLAGAALSQAAQSAVLAAPISVREQVLAQAPSVLASATGKPWSHDGFPRRRRRGRHLLQAAAGVVVAVVVLFGVGVAVDDGLLDPVAEQPVLDAGPVAEEPASTGAADPATPGTTPASGDEGDPGGVAEEDPVDSAGGTSGVGDPLEPGTDGTDDGSTTPTDPGDGGGTGPGTPPMDDQPATGETPVEPGYDPKIPGYDPKNPGGTQGGSGGGVTQGGQGSGDTPTLIVPTPTIWVPPTIFVPTPSTPQLK